VIALRIDQVLLRLFVALLLGIFVGVERERRGRPAGMRTLGLVSMGSAFFMILSAYGFAGLGSAEASRVDPSRIAAQIVTGIGFLGAGTILLHRRTVQGLTTAAAVWTIAAIGMACGLGLLLDAVGSTVLGLVVLLALRPVEGYLFHRREARHRILLSVSPGEHEQLLAGIASACRAAAVHLESIELRKKSDGGTIIVRTGPASQSDLLRLAHQLEQLSSVRAVRADLRSSRERPARIH
jgi:putative Mg2+ transporter-C (MgtC) family protein